MSFNTQYCEYFSNLNEDYNLLNNKQPNETPKPDLKTKPKVNTFPLAWTCYKNKGKWICPMRGDKK